MKFSAILLSTLITAASAFSPSSNRRAVFASLKVATEPEVSAGPSQEPVDKTLEGIDDDATHDIFDPLEGEKPALIRNNKDEVWVQQVCFLDLWHKETLLD